MMGLWNRIKSFFVREKKSKPIKYDNEEGDDFVIKKDAPKNKVRKTYPQKKGVKKSSKTKKADKVTNKEKKSKVKKGKKAPSMSNNSMNEYNFEISGQIKYEGRNTKYFLEKYNTILSNKISYDKLKKDIISNKQFSEQLLRKRGVIIIDVIGKSNEKEFDRVRFNIIGALPEDEMFLQELMIGDKIVGGADAYAKFILESFRNSGRAVKAVNSTDNRGSNFELSISRIVGGFTFK